jgi:hypothetical protein
MGRGRPAGAIRTPTVRGLKPVTPSDLSTAGWCQERDSNPHCPDSETGDSCRWSILASCHPRDSNPHCPAPQAGASCRWARVAYRVRASSPRDAASKATVLRQPPGEENDGLEPYGVNRALLSREAPRHRGFVFQEEEGELESQRSRAAPLSKRARTPSGSSSKRGVERARTPAASPPLPLQTGAGRPAGFYSEERRGHDPQRSRAAAASNRAPAPPGSPSMLST